MSSTEWHIGGGRSLDLRTPAVMGILNVTPDSFSDGGRHDSVNNATRHALGMIDEGATIIDIGGESTRPGAQAVPAKDQIERVLPVIRSLLSERPDTVISIDTTLAAVAEAAIEAGAAIVNDVSAGEGDAGMLPLVADRLAGLVLMHRHTTPERDAYSDAYSSAPMEGDAVRTVAAYLRDRLSAAEAIGVDARSVALDPGLGFGKTVEQNLDLIARTPELLEIGRPVLSGLSRKSFAGRVSLERDSDPAERLAGTIALTALHRAAGASIFRVHDVAEALQAIRSADVLASTSRMTR